MEVSFQVDEWGEYGEDGDHLTSCMSLGDNFAMNAEKGNKEGQDFYILLCIKIIFTINTPFKCPWGQEFCVGDMVVASKYYYNWSWLKSSYVLLIRSQIAYIHACHVRTIKFPMALVDHKVWGNELLYKFLKHA
jgi:hypothetical protein